jgi:hypothetical protein
MEWLMESLARHQCVIYEGSPWRNLHIIAEIMRQKLSNNYRCFYLNSPPMVAGMRSYLAAAGVDVAQEIAKSRLMLSAERQHLVEGNFNIERMMRTLESALAQALKDGYKGLWATGDMSWELGPRHDFATLLEYEWRLEEFFRSHPHLSGICQYHRDTLPVEMIRQGLAAHPAIFVNETLSQLNPHYIRAESFAAASAANHSHLDRIIDRLCQGQETN